ncbi:hypothetical protein GCM10022254_27320 [Actinomadura meridiana]|uniref:FMN hydroxy acid dehydrogenase domain-containing protein n=1 Tax=Actinomadura meridiana TaxID=559626 RepID=A0ABP8BZU9_9ACTN
MARERLGPSIWSFVEGGAGEEDTFGENTAAFRQYRLRPRVLAGVAEPELRTKILDRTWNAPLAVAPMAFQTLAHPAGELATVRGAGLAGVPVIVNTLSGCRFEDLAEAARSPLWLQLYCFRDRAVTRRLIARAEDAGFEAIVLTVDAPWLGRRLQNLREGLRLPPGVQPANLEPPSSGSEPSPGGGVLAEFDPSLDWRIIDWLRSVTRLPILLKGVMTGADGARAVEAGVSGVIVSNHNGGRLDGMRSALDALPEVAAAVAGRCPVLLDGGVRKGTDILVSLALGADAVLLGRPVLNGLAVAGEPGVAAVLDLTTDELADAMVLTGTPSVADADADLIRTGPPAPTGPPRGASHPPTTGLRREDLFAALTDPVMDTMNFLNEVTARYPDAISLAPGRPYDGFFDVEHIVDHLRRYIDHLAQEGFAQPRIRDALFQYGPSAGMIRGFIADALRRDEGIDVAPEAIVVTVGCQEAMFLTLRALFASPTDVLLVSTPSYVGITGAARLLGIEAIPIEEGPEGLSPLDLESAIAFQAARGRRVRAVYVIPDHCNPTGVTIPVEARRHLLDVAAREGVLLLEDSPYRLVSPGPRVPTLKSLDRHRTVIHLGSFSKTVLPGARVGFAVADQQVVDADGRTTPLADELAKIKSMVTVNTPALSQAVIAGALLAGTGGVAELNRDTSDHYDHAMRTTLRELERQFPPGRLDVTWNAPAGGFFLTFNVPFRADNAALTRSAERFGVIWTPMSYFYPDGGGERALRLSISYLSDEEITEGVARLARFVASEGN